MRIEAETLLEEGRHAPEHVPTMHFYSQAMSLIAMAYLAPPHVMLRLGIIAGETYPQLGAHMGSFLARTLFHTSLFALDSAQYRCRPLCNGPLLQCRTGNNSRATAIVDATK